MTDSSRPGDGPSPHAWRAAVAALADPERLRLFARVVLDPPTEAGLGREDRRRIAPLLAAGIVVREDSDPVRLRAEPARFAALLAGVSAPRPTGPERFLAGNRPAALPRRQADRDELLPYLAARVLPLLEPVSEPALTRRLAALMADPVGARRALVDAGLVTRARDGSEYWRTHVTDHDTRAAGDGAP